MVIIPISLLICLGNSIVRTNNCDKKTDLLPFSLLFLHNFLGGVSIDLGIILFLLAKLAAYALSTSGTFPKGWVL